MRKLWVVLAASIALAGCKGKDGGAGPTGPTGSGVQTFTATFREGANGYAGTLVSLIEPSAPNATDQDDFSIITSSSTNWTRVLLQFPIQYWIPQNVTVKAASVALFVNGLSGTRTIGAHAVHCAWTGNATWNKLDGVNAWGNCSGSGSNAFAVGSNFTATPMSTVTLSPSGINGGTVAWTLSPSVVQAWLNTSGGNDGLVFMSEAEGAETSGFVFINSPNDATVNYRPELTIQYTIP